MKKNRKKSIIFLVILAALALFMTGCMEKEKSYETALQKINDGRYEEALNYLNLSVSQGNQDRTLYAHKALVLLKLEREHEAEAALMIAVSGETESIDIQKLCGVYYFEKGDYDTAMQKFLRVKQMTEAAGKEYDSETLGYIAQILMAQGQYEQAILYLNRVILASYRLTEHELLAGKCYLKVHQFKAAGQYFEMVDKQDDRKPSHYLFMYDECMEAGAYSLAETCFAKGKSLCGTKNQEMTLGEYYARAGLLENAEESLVKEDTVGSLLTQAWILAYNGDYEESGKIYETLIARNEDIEEVYVSYMTEKVMEGDVAAAKLLLEKIKTFDDEKIQKRAAWNEVILYEKEGDFDAAYKALVNYKNTYGTDEETSREIIFLERVLK